MAAQEKNAMTAMITVRLGPSTTASESASTMYGKASTASVNRARIVSITPPKYPAIRPTTTPATVPIAVVTKPTNREMRAPYRIRMNRSRPVPSLPSQKPAVPGPTGLPAASSPVFGYAMFGGW